MTTQVINKTDFKGYELADVECVILADAFGEVADDLGFILNMRNASAKYAKDCIVEAMAACYKEQIKFQRSLYSDFALENDDDLSSLLNPVKKVIAKVCAFNCEVSCD